MSVYQNIYLDKYLETEQHRVYEKLTVDQRFVIEYFTVLCSTFKWTKLPAGILPINIEKFLNYSGRLAFFKDGDNFKMFPAYPAGALMEDGEYEKYTVIAPNGKNWIINREDCEIIFNNLNKLPYYFIVANMAKDSSYALRCVNTTLKRAMLPPVIGVDTEEQMKKILEIENPEEMIRTVAAIYRDGGFGEKGIERVPIFDNREADVLSQWDVFSRYDRMFYRTFGVSTVGIQKNERLTEAESTGEEEMTRYSFFQDMYDCRKDGCERVKKHFGFDLDFEINRDKKSVFEITQNNEEKVELSKIESTKGANFQTTEGGNNSNEETETE